MNDVAWAIAPTRASPPESRAGFGSGMDAQFAEHTLRMVAGGVGADLQPTREGAVRQAVGEEQGHLRLAWGQAVIAAEPTGE